MAGLTIPSASRSASEPPPSAPPPPGLPLQELNFRAMGCDCQVLILGGSPQLLELAQQRVTELDQRWSRFIPQSDLCRFNARAGHTVRVSPDLLLLLRRGLAGFRTSVGLFNPFLGTEIVAAGYDRDYSELDTAPPVFVDQPVGTKPTMRQIRRARLRSPLRLNITRGLARLDTGVEFDSGGIGKGLGADVVVDHVLKAGAQGAMVSLGGDVAVGGSFPDQGWRIGVDDPFGRPDREALSVVLRSGSLCSSGILKRRWQQHPGHTAHHIIDPATGLPRVPNGIVAVSAIAPDGWRAEVLTKTALVGGQVAAHQLMSGGNYGLLLWNEDGELMR